MSKYINLDSTIKQLEKGLTANKDSDVDKIIKCLIDILKKQPVTEINLKSINALIEENERLEAENERLQQLFTERCIVAPMPMAEWLRNELTKYVYNRCMEEL